MKTNAFEYPETSKDYAQHFFCFSLNYSSLEIIGLFIYDISFKLISNYFIADHFVVSRPLIQSFQLPESIGKAIPKLKDVFNHVAEKNASLSISTPLNATKNEFILQLITKSRKFHQGITKN